MTVFLGCVKRIVRSPLSMIFLFIFPMMFTVLSGLVQMGSEESAPISIGIADMDGTALSRAVAEYMGERYKCRELAERDIEPALSEQKVSWVLKIPEGYQADLLGGRAPKLEGVSIALSDVQFLASSSAEAMTRALLALVSGAGESDIDRLLLEWNPGVTAVSVPLETAWEDVLFWVSLHGWISMLTAFFLVRIIMTDRHGGLPERVGVLPLSRRMYTLQSILAIFVLCEISTAAMLVGVNAVLSGAMPNAAHIFLLMSVYNIFTTALSVALFSAFRSDTNVSMMIVMFSTLFSMLGGTYWPVEFMPDFMQKLAVCSPNYWLGTGLANAGVITFENFWMPVVVLFGFTAVAFFLGSLRRVTKAES